MQTVFRQRHGVSGLLEDADRDALIDDVVFGQQDLAMRARVSVRTRQSAWPPSSRVRPSVCENRLAQRRLPDGLHQIRRDAEVAAADRVHRLARRGQHHDGRRRAPLSSFSSFGGREPVHPGHVGVEQHERERVAALGRPSRPR